MANELTIYATPPHAQVTCLLDNGVNLLLPSTIANGREDAHQAVLPGGTTTQGCVITATCDGRVSQRVRGTVFPADLGPAAFWFDDFGELPLTVAPPPEPDPPPVESDPLTLIQAVYATGAHDLSTKEGCGQFTEACCTSLHEHNSEAWMHDARTPPQNNYNGHAVDAIQCIAGQYYGMWDIIHSSVSPDASPCFNLAGPPNPGNAFYPAAPLK